MVIKKAYLIFFFYFVLPVTVLLILSLERLDHYMLYFKRRCRGVSSASENG